MQPSPFQHLLLRNQKNLNRCDIDIHELLINAWKKIFLVGEALILLRDYY